MKLVRAFRYYSNRFVSSQSFFDDEINGIGKGIVLQDRCIILVIVIQVFLPGHFLVYKTEVLHIVLRPEKL